MAMFSLIGLACVMTVREMIHLREVRADRAERLYALQQTMQILERDMLQHLPRPIRDGLGDARPALELINGEKLTLTVAGWRNPLQHPRSELQRVSWYLSEDGHLQRRFWQVLDRAQDSAPVHWQLLQDVQDWQIELLSAEGRSWQNWPQQGTDADAPAPPRLQQAIALRLSFSLEPYGQISRLFLLHDMAEGGHTPSGEPGS